MVGQRTKKELLLACPRCEGALQRIRRRDLALDVCRRCGGVWFDRAELDGLRHQHPRAFTYLDHAFTPRGEPRVVVRGALICPLCAEALVPFSFPHAPQVELDGCPACGGIWVDRGELTLLEAAARTGEQPPEPVRPRPCPRCGTPVLRADAVCPVCGEPVPAALEGPTPNAAGGAQVSAQGGAPAMRSVLPPKVRRELWRIHRIRRWERRPATRRTLAAGIALVALGLWRVGADLLGLVTHTPVPVHPGWPGPPTYAPLSGPWYCDLLAGALFLAAGALLLWRYRTQDVWREDPAGARRQGSAAPA